MATTRKKTTRTASKSKAAAQKSKAIATAPMIKTFPSAVKSLLDRPNFERLRPGRIDRKSFKLARMESIMKALGDPHRDINAVHVAGTIGKGSTVAMMRSMLEGCGWTTGTYTSPHLMDIRERIAINGTNISQAAFAKLAKEVSKAADDVAPDATFFEVITAMSFLHFAEAATDVAIIETGLGGRLDATNVLTPSVSLITRIDYDHQYLLGDSLAEIAREKAGIFKSGVPALSVKQEPEAEAVLREVAEKVGAELRFIGKEIEFSSRFCVTDESGAHMRVCLLGERMRYMHLPVPLPGSHQADNCALALAALDMVGGKTDEFDESVIFRGLAKTKNPGRMDLVWNRPRILVDGAHNPASMQALMRGIGSHLSFDSMICIFGCNEDKDVDANLEKLAIGGDKIIFTKAADQPRAMEPEDLVKRFEKLRNRTCQSAPTVEKAIQIAAQASGREDLICVTGSFYLVGETMTYLEKLRARQA
ncbi:MAG: folylpolyglutamate synthase/dihydrofolate synthase family protein [Phycisphaerales bacterium]|jgi:dihydrofolate synthase/folylpolyglutamate synthase|nr:folylpolyglutamate synthase/dihydrofolate synthase family protein [Phycisphaerales bacterium]MDP6310566.1 folylpolyglutamate synthase/dihydrofolate synthase family protein [Phycisphaerales bacterium]MDP7086849.1 folylpolyglutamate synthase/dihydrofolate synthase family protein [Phycisphaerales bacterium]MDP7188790.1 folylpolyglutamate synthase/dihydrofolate synthase family protein [Phycisphaerales bacterium]MDP7519654.1 folylpolyglutamate synthase/dihydrofolate synthase family protein [Phyci|tara:strand:+ start:570 stop:2003 length:1434 start_codon:yes stop_codon:yes gene_type:complete